MSPLEVVTRKKALSPILIIIILILMIIATIIVSMNLGMIRLSPLEVFTTLFGSGTEKQELILFNFRLPRIIIAIFAGMGLSVSGAILQGLARNGLADPGVLGINAGAGLGAVLVIIFTVSNPQNVNVFILPFVA